MAQKKKSLTYFPVKKKPPKKKNGCFGKHKQISKFMKKEWEEKLKKIKGIYSANYIRPEMPSGKRHKGKYREIPFSTLKREF